MLRPTGNGDECGEGCGCVHGWAMSGQLSTDWGPGRGSPPPTRHHGLQPDTQHPDHGAADTELLSLLYSFPEIPDSVNSALIQISIISCSLQMHDGQHHLFCCPFSLFFSSHSSFLQSPSIKMFGKCQNFHWMTLTNGFLQGNE